MSLWRRPCGSIVAACTPNGRSHTCPMHNMTNHLLGGDIDMTRDEYNKMRGSSVREVASTHGSISFRDVLLFHREE